MDLRIEMCEYEIVEDSNLQGIGGKININFA